VRVVPEAAAGIDRPRSSARARRAAVLAYVCFVLFALLALAVQMGWSRALDLRLMLALAPHRPAWCTYVMRIASFLGSGAVEIPLALLFSLRLAAIRRRPEAAGYASATLSGWALYGLLKFLFQRARPHVIPRLMSGGGGWYAFPSGHASLAPLVFGLGALIWSAPWPAARRLALVAAVSVLSLLIAFSRVYIGVHWPTDALGGLLMGTGWAALWVWWWERAGQRRPSSPASPPS
jgi:undecaprenyl-diphosphatase